MAWRELSCRGCPWNIRGAMLLMYQYPHKWTVDAKREIVLSVTFLRRMSVSEWGSQYSVPV